ncbi:MAG: tRNA (guanosine(37)-N1)-methyltransferase TrmD [Candidatus Liptonbacteria bacterium CG11_big_fil_rev_8_21_14_0_20_35_14]|uniref:tRNA (guanine-N(1)-)-methyltransferase n=1 Tax=Candidatus Liptonbacteria bacterium CG11_big_fil_rev_8_21_14_0_20_35_14 TaxID=1974634 RepID=A0A2H0N783_9BACT|nr:MAG: tRNA (guanosine(37)-N1)-methyltransferase TrmD [Candidatus Liptonbacteria bacterium CG11_big_fil_rev_8_21_14_0_20_35_14]
MKKKNNILFDVITVFPKSIETYLNESLLLRAQNNKLINIKIHNLRDFLKSPKERIDDKPFGGGPGMVLAFEPIYKAVKKIKNKNKKNRVILFSTRGKVYNKKEALRLTKYEQVILICGKYEGVDERVAQYIADEEISIGDFVLMGGEIPAMLLIDTMARFVPGVLGDYKSLEENKGSYPVYTRPEVIEIKEGNKKKKLIVPKVLLSGNHKEIEESREER